MMPVRAVLSFLPGLMLAAVMGAAPAQAQIHSQSRIAPDALVLGRDLNGDPCGGGVTFNDPQVSAYDRVYVITCRSASAGRWQGQAMAYSAKYTKPKLTQPCGDEKEVELKDVGKVTARQCYNTALSQPIVMIRFQRGDQVYLGEAVFTAVAPLETALRTLSGISAPVTDRYLTRDASFDPRSLPAVAMPTDTTAVGSAFNADVSLRAGIQSNQEGAYFEASQTLNGALSRLSDDMPAATRAEFDLEAALADSNIGQTDAADLHFADASALLSANEKGVSAFLIRKQSTYRALDAINRHQWLKALEALRAGETQANPLQDPAMLSALNQSLPPAAGQARAGGPTALADRGELKNELLEAQRYWAASVAWWALSTERTVPLDTLAGLSDIQPCPTPATPRGVGFAAPTGKYAPYVERSATAIDCSVELVTVLQRNVNPAVLLPIKSRIQRQYGRLQIAENRIPQAVQSFDCALALLEGGQIADSSGCVFSLAGAQSIASAPGAFAGPIIAATEFERANLLSLDPKRTTDAKIAAFSSAVESLLASGNTGEAQSVDLERYFDLLVRRYNADHSPETAELYFRAVQSIGEPAAARQVAQLQAVVTADSSLASRVRDRAELQRRVIQLRYQLANNTGLDAAGRTALEQEQGKAEAELAAIEFDLKADQHFDAVNDQPVRIADIRGALNSGEYYMKVSMLKTKAYGIVVSPQRTYLYTLAVPSRDLKAWADQVRQSIRNGSGELPQYDVRTSFALYNVVTGPAAQDIRLARTVIVDPSGPLENLPPGTLVTSKDSAKAYYAMVTANPANRDDYSHVDFLGRRADIFYALSPRSLLIAHGLKPTSAQQAFIGFGENAPPPAITSAYQGVKISVGNCNMDYDAFLQVMGSNKPVSAREIGLAAGALGDPSAPEITGSAFTDVDVLKASNTDAYTDYKVIHFATHGVAESPILDSSGKPCGVIPPSLITTVAPIDASGKVVSDGFLTFSDVAQMHFDANLVVLSACDTAAGVSNQLGRQSGQEESGETLDGLVRAFITAGSRAVLATYWQVPASTDTDSLIQTFYSSGRIFQMDTALRTAQRQLIGNPATSHPYFWGAYVLIGDGSKTMLSGAAVKTASN